MGCAWGQEPDVGTHAGGSAAGSGSSQAGSGAVGVHDDALSVRVQDIAGLQIEVVTLNCADGGMISEELTPDIFGKPATLRRVRRCRPGAIAFRTLKAA